MGTPGKDSAHPGRFSGQALPGLPPGSLETWKMNLMAVSEKHRVIVIAVLDKLHVYGLDPFSAEVIKE